MPQRVVHQEHPADLHHAGHRPAVRRLRGVREEDDILRSLAQQQRLVDRAAVGAQNAERMVANS
ncbi:hypothetical protein [Streptomyces sp. LS1784]|uniref:hypothetical protein n=1 Tax=Streptomyces sp. LS1784 TaxID=2851533 RepID=UPI0035A8E6C7